MIQLQNDHRVLYCTANSCLLVKDVRTTLPTLLRYSYAHQKCMIRVRVAGNSCLVLRHYKLRSKKAVIPQPSNSSGSGIGITVHAMSTAILHQESRAEKDSSTLKQSREATLQMSCDINAFHLLQILP